MKLIVFGATGNCGGHFVTLAAAAGHAVTAVARAGSAVAEGPGVTVVRGDVLDGAFVRDVVGGHDAVMSGLGMRYRHPWAQRRSPDDLVSRATGHIIDGMRAAGMARIAIISAGGVGDSRAGLNWMMRALVATSNLGYAYADLQRAETLLAHSGLDWLAVRPTTLTHSHALGARVTSRYGTLAHISRRAVAAFVLHALTAEHFAVADHTPMITRAPAPAALSRGASTT